MPGPRRPLARLAVLALLLAGACSPSPGAVGGSTPISAGRLSSARLEGLRDGPVWAFDAGRVVLTHGAGALPDDLARVLLGGPTQARRLVARWALEGDELVLSELELDGAALPGTARLPIAPAGHVRVDLGARQYALLPATAGGSGGTDDG